MTATEIQSILTVQGDPTKAEHAQKFFKTGPGEYGEGDVFRGIRVPELRKTARSFRKLPLSEALVLLHSPYHEDRFVALCILVHLYEAGARDEVYRAYLEHTHLVNNWDLVDTSVHKIVGHYLLTRVRRPLYTLAVSRSLWERRMAIIATYRFIRHDQFSDTLALSAILLEDAHDLIHKAVGWMLREVGKRDEQLLVDFLGLHYHNMPRTMLRYAIERFDKVRRRSYIEGIIAPAHGLVAPWQAYRAVMEADRRLRSFHLKTPLLKASAISREAGADIRLKQEHLQQTGSFKVRGALSKLLSLNSTNTPIVAASTGNHGLAVAHAMSELGCTGTIFLPENADAYKVAALREYGVDLKFVGQDGVEAERAAREVAELNGHEFVSPYNDWAVIGGQGIVGLEILAELTSVSHVFAAVGGGGLIAGVAAVMKAHNPEVQVVGCSPQASPVMHESVRAGRIVNWPAATTLSDGTAGGIEPGAITFTLCKQLVDTWITVTEEEIASAMRRLYHDYDLMVEGSAGVAMAGLLKTKRVLAGQCVAVILCGGNIKPVRFESIVQDAGHPA